MKAEWTNRDSLSIEETTSRNSKSILVIDTPNNCTECPLLQDYQCSPLGEMQNFVDIGRNGRCPLRPLPEANTWDVTENGHVTEFAEGWNACLDEITGETE